MTIKIHHDTTFIAEIDLSDDAIDISNIKVLEDKLHDSEIIVSVDDHTLTMGMFFDRIAAEDTAEQALNILRGGF